MKANYLKYNTSSETVEKVRAYLRPKIDENFIKTRMNMLAESHLQYLHFWPLLIRDSKHVCIQMPVHELYGYNFAAFVQSMIKNKKTATARYFGQFCIQAIANNPNLLLNRYYVGNGGSPVLQMMTSYLLNRRINGTIQKRYEQIQQPLFNIVKIAFENNLIDFQSNTQYYYSLEFLCSSTSKTMETIALILNKIEKYILSRRQQGQVEDQWKRERCDDAIQRLFQSFFRYVSYDGFINYQSFEWSPIDKQKMIEELSSTNPIIRSTLKMVGQNYKIILLEYKKMIAKSMIVNKKQANLILELLFYPEFMEIMFTEQFIFPIFSTRNRKVCELLWSFEEKRQTTSQLMLNGKNLLEHVCEIRGLTHNIISMLWQSGLFGKKMPKIMNKKSRAILNKKYGMQMNETQEIEQSI